MKLKTALLTVSVWLLQLLLLFNNYNFVECVLNITVSKNVNTVKVGQPFTIRCEVTNYELGIGSFDLDFVYNQSKIIAYYSIPDLKSVNQEAKFVSQIENADNSHITHTSPLGNRFPVFEISITLNSTFNTEFFCQADYNTAVVAKSNKITLLSEEMTTQETTIPANVTTPLITQTTQTTPTFPRFLTTTPLPSTPQLILTSNSSTVRLYEPNNFNCHIDYFHHQGTKYQISFFNNRDGQLASYEIDAAGNSFFSAGENEKFSAHQGEAVSAFPNFDFVITEKVDRKLKYWCTLVVNTKEYLSNSWQPQGPFVEFITSTNTVGGQSEHRGRCSVDNFAQHDSVEYRIKYVTSLGPRMFQDNVLAYYWIRTNKGTEFVHELNFAPWSSIFHGANDSYPDFEVVTKINGNLVEHRNHNYWWQCVLAVGKPSEFNYQEIYSNTEQLFFDF